MGLDFLLQETPIINPQKKEPFSQEMYLKISILGRA
jgi:hypothetical protein